MDEAKKVSNFVCENKLDCPTTVCAKQIDKLTVANTQSKPVKLARKCLSKEQKAIINSHLPKPVTEVAKVGFGNFLTCKRKCVRY